MATGYEIFVKGRNKIDGHFNARDWENFKCERKKHIKDSIDNKRSVWVKIKRMTNIHMSKDGSEIEYIKGDTYRVCDDSNYDKVSDLLRSKEFSNNYWVFTVWSCDSYFELKGFKIKALALRYKKSIEKTAYCYYSVYFKC